MRKWIFEGIFEEATGDVTTFNLFSNMLKTCAGLKSPDTTK